MKHRRFILFILLLTLVANISLADNRFYPANSIRCSNVLEQVTDEYDPINREYKKKHIYYHYYTGNDTIVDGSPCVMLWKYSSETPKEKELRFIREVEGVVSCKYPLAEGGYTDWTIMFEFPYGGWVKGEKYIDGLINGEPAIFPANPTTYTLLNGEKIQLNFNTLMYGIGYNDWPFFEFRNFGETTDIRPYNYYRNGTLLWGNEHPLKHERFFPANSIRCTNMVTSMFNNDTTYYNLYTGSDTIVDGKECVQLWEYCTDRPDNLEQHLLHEEAGKVYIKYAAAENDDWQLLYDFSLPKWYVGDCIEDTEYGHLAIESIDTIPLLNGKTRQVANCSNGSLIHGIGYAGQPFFSPINRLEPEDGTVWHPVSFYKYNQLLWGKELPKKREQRFFPANGVYTTNVYHGPEHSDYFEIIEPRDTIYYNQWIGNDTIVDGRECVVVWNNRGGVAKRFGIIYESLNGLVYFNYASDEPYSPNYWLCLYDFTPRKWKMGDMICTNYDGTTELYEEVEKVSSIILQDGKKVPSIEIYKTSIIHGIGYSSEPFLSPMEAYNGCSGKNYPVNFYRNGVLLWGEESNTHPSKTYLVTEGKQWAVCRHSFRGEFWTETYRLQGDTIINGKTYKIEHAARNEDLSDMKPSGRYMREEDGRVYSITDKDQRDDFVFDYSMEIGDTLFYNPHTDYYGNVYKHHTCLRLIAIRDTIIPNGDGRVRKCYDTEEGCLNGDDVYEFHPVLHSFIEDIGYTATGLSSSEIGTTGVGYSLLYVKQGDTILYQQEEGVLWKDNTGIEVPKSEQADIYYDLQGRPVAHPIRGVYIKDGKKVIIKD